MACRKAAYRSMVEVSEWKEEQQAKANARLRQLREELQPIWTPKHIFERCCAQFIQYGSGVYQNSTAECSGGCGKAHPRITLDFREKKSFVRLSHGLDPFLQYFEKLIDQGLATKNQNKDLEYGLEGFLQDHIERLNSSKVIPKHMIQVSPAALAASRRAHERFLDQQGELEWHAAKRRKQASYAKTPTHLLESVFEICYLHNLLEHLDLCEIAWMRLSGNPIVSKIAARMASARLEEVSLSFSVVEDENERDHQKLLKREEDDTNGVLTFVPSDFCVGLGLLNRSSTVRIYLKELCLPDPYGKSSIPEHDYLFPRGPLQIFEYQHRRDLTGHTNIGVYPNGFFRVTLKFSDLLGIQVRRKLAVAKTKLQDIQSKRPATRGEKEYVKALAKEARMAPGNSLMYRHFEGW